MNPNRFFLITATIFGILYALIVPPFQAPDEFNHFYRSWQIAEGGMIGKKTADNRLGDSLPTSLLSISKPFTYLPFHFEQRIKTNTIFTLLQTPLNNQERSFVDFTNTAVYAPTAYLSQSIAIFIFKNLGFTPLSIFYLSRLLTLFFWIAIVYASIKIIPIHRWLFAFLALLPSSLFINSSLNADVLTNAFSFLAISLFVKKFFESGTERCSVVNVPPTEQRSVPLLLTTLIISLNKIAYLPITFLVFLIPKEHFHSAKQKHVFTFLFVAANIAVVVWWSKMIAPLYIRFEDYNPSFRLGQQLNEGVDPIAQFSFIMHNPLTYIQIMMTSFAQTMPHTLIHYVGKFGWEKNYLPIGLILPLFLMILLRGCGTERCSVESRVASTEQRSVPQALKYKIAIIATLMSASLATAMYLLWCPVGSHFIENLSGKYFIPIFPLFFLALPTFEFKKYSFLTNEKWISALLWLTLCYGVWQVWTRYYI